MFDQLCASQFWNTSQVWEGSQPYLSACFRNTVLVWLPAGLFLLASCVESFVIAKSKAFPIPWNSYNVTRLLIALLLLAAKLLDLAFYLYLLYYGDPQSCPQTAELVREADIAYLQAYLVQSGCHALLALIYLMHRRKGIHTSGTVWFYLVALMTCQTVDTYVVVANQALGTTLVVAKCAHFLLIILLFVVECKGDTPVLATATAVDSSTSQLKESPELTASFASNITFWWFNGFLMHGFRHRIEFKSFWRTMVRDQCSRLAMVFKKRWISRSKSKQGVYQITTGAHYHKNNILWVLLNVFKRRLLLAVVLKLCHDTLQFTVPMVLKLLISFMSTKDTPLWHGVVIAVLMLIVPNLQSMFLGNYFHTMQLIGLHSTKMITGIVYRKALVLSGTSRLQSTRGEIVNLMSVDAQRFQDLPTYLNLIWSGPLQLVVSIVLIYRELGWAVFAGVLSIILVIPLNTYISTLMKMSQMKLMGIKDQRIKHLTEMLAGIKVIKLSAWENSFISQLLTFREQELQYLKKNSMLDATSVFLWQASPFLVAVVSFAVFVVSDPKNVLTAEKAFVSLSLFTLLRFPLVAFSNLVTNLIMALVSAKRLNDFLNTDELVSYVTREEESDAISVEGATMSWSSDSKENNVLKDIDFHVKPGKFIAVIGQVASGKSSLLSSILGEMYRVSGRFNVRKSMKLSYVPQQAWIQNMTVRDNILFGEPYDEELYDKVLSVCSLHADLASLSGGNFAEIGEKGINLSGGQKQRVSLARACYSKSDIYLFDDPLSALDSHVAKHVFNEVLSSSTGLLKDKTRVLATNTLFVLPHVDYIYVMDNGKIVEHGTYKQLIASESGHLKEYMQQYNHESEEEGEKQKVMDATASDPMMQVISKDLAPEEDQKAKKKAELEKGKLISEEKFETGSVGSTVYFRYLKSASVLWTSTMVVFLILSTGFNLATSFWLSLWSSDSEDPKLHSDTKLRNIRLLVYIALGTLQCLCILIGALAVAKGSARASKMLHSDMLDRVMHSPMLFFDTTPMGRLVNRFAKDIDAIDIILPTSFRSWTTFLLSLVATFFIVCYSFPMFLLILVPMLVIYYLVQKIFIVSTRQLKRLESISRSPIYSHFNETLSGLSTIRAYSRVLSFINQSDDMVDRNQNCNYANVMANRWISLRLEHFGNLITFSVSMFSVFSRGIISPGVTGLTISYCMSITQTLSWFIRTTSELETNIVSVERVLEYTKNKLEDLWIKTLRPSTEWPANGSLKFDSYSTRYREDSELVLQDVSLDIRAGEKIGIVGRTGSGKSSLSLSLFRILEPVTGRILIDNLNISDIGLHDLRSRLTIIPQDPVLVSGTLRYNLDPLGSYTDSDLWRAIELAHLKRHIEALSDGLDYTVNEYGENFSVGQRQLICLARAILRKSKILVLDEATASVDLETDNIVQKTIRDIFNDCTILTIAHRLHTILDSDRILVLEGGKVLELDSPENLLSKPGSAFSSLVRDAGIDVSSIMQQGESESESRKNV